MNKGLDAFGEAVANWLNRRYALERPVDPATEVLVLNGTREGLFLAALAAKNWVKPRAGRPAVLIPNPFYAAYSAGAIAADCEPVYLPATAETGFLPDLNALSDDLLARTVACYLASPSNPQGAVADRAYLGKLAALAQRFGFLVFLRRMLLRDLQRPAAAGHAGGGGAGFRQRRRVSFALEAFEPARPARRLRRGRPAISRGLSGIAQRRRAAGGDAGAARRHRRLWRRDPRRRKSAPLPREIRSRRSDRRRPLRLPAAGRRVFSLAQCRGARRQRGSDARTVEARPACAWCPAAISRANRPTAAIPAPTISASPWCRAKTITAEALHRLVAVLG